MWARAQRSTFEGLLVNLRNQSAVKRGGKRPVSDKLGRLKESLRDEMVEYKHGLE
jgi:hypothetical protein